jgi:hypothetical protein
MKILHVIASVDPRDETIGYARRRRSVLGKRPRSKAAPTATVPGDAKGVKEAPQLNDRALIDLRLITQTISALWIPGGTSKEVAKERIQSAIALVKDLKPTDGLEGMLASQMVATRDAAMECLRRAMIADQTFAGVEQNLKHAAKLMSLYARQIEALNKHRGKCQQKVTVEHVHVAAGGQAMVGHIETAPKPSISGDQSKDTPKAIAHMPEEAFEMKSEARVPVKQRKK